MLEGHEKLLARLEVMRCKWLVFVRVKCKFEGRSERQVLANLFPEVSSCFRSFLIFSCKDVDNFFSITICK